MSKLKTLKDIKEIDREYSGILTPADGKEYNHKIGEPKYYTSYKCGRDNLRNAAKEWVEHLHIEHKLSLLECERRTGVVFKDYGLTPHDLSIEWWITHFFNLEEE